MSGNLHNVIFKANNSSGEQELHLTSSNNEFWFTLLGKFKRESIQIDFDSMSKEDLIQHRNQIDILLNNKQ